MHNLCIYFKSYKYFLYCVAKKSWGFFFFLLLLLQVSSKANYFVGHLEGSNKSFFFFCGDWLVHLVCRQIIFVLLRNMLKLNLYVTRRVARSIGFLLKIREFVENHFRKFVFSLFANRIC